MRPLGAFGHGQHDHGLRPAAAAATQSLLLARRIGAPRCVRLVDDLLPRFEPYAHASGVAELLQLAAA
ncbi:hypothetical protein [Streptomyces pseudovenezuelae]|uniref:Uncharacterized protein n=1 Tax=Streptomyces pseudovenezuelae TaxID=67350 RepID=A0ABT6LZN2_9ACTN|nr:hypothetical protein [Streptomyces pseudovenezuelae]MDH6221760.1 hypothetical protein [Streptomyces pseudovenezuelae]